MRTLIHVRADERDEEKAAQDVPWQDQPPSAASHDYDGMFGYVTVAFENDFDPATGERIQRCTGCRKTLSVVSTHHRLQHVKSKQHYPDGYADALKKKAAAKMAEVRRESRRESAIGSAGDGIMKAFMASSKATGAEVST